MFVSERTASEVGREVEKKKERKERREGAFIARPSFRLIDSSLRVCKLH